MWNREAEVRRLEPLDENRRAKARKRLKEQTRPAGSLGHLESFIERLTAIQKNERPFFSRKGILLFAADHGVTEEGVSPYPREVTRAMVLNFLSGGATINAIARQVQAGIQVVDVGVAADFEAHPQLVQAKVARGTKNMAKEPAMTSAEFERAFKTGWDMAGEAGREGIEILALGEMGIGNTTAASAIAAALLGCPAAQVTGRGTGLDDAGLERKIAVIEKALALHEASLKNAADILGHVGGFEIAALSGAILGGAQAGLPVVIDGWIVSVAALAAVRMNPAVLDYLFFAHQSAERGHRLLLETLEVQPILNLSMRLGEASGAGLALGILDAALCIYRETATFTQAGVADRV